LSQCVFFSGFGDPEVYVRPDNTAYCTGFPDPPVRVTEQPGLEEVRSDAIAKIQTSVQQASSMSEDLLLSNISDEKVLKQACYLPSTADGTPMMGLLQDRPQTFVCAGHTCWGILMGPASGEAMASLIATGDSPHVNLSPFDPARFGTLSMVPQTSSHV
jgi:glycine/D-amino acid oxidase-like deaminating enzyme